MVENLVESMAEKWVEMKVENLVDSWVAWLVATTVGSLEAWRVGMKAARSDDQWGQVSEQAMVVGWESKWGLELEPDSVLKMVLGWELGLEWEWELQMVLKMVLEWELETVLWKARY